MTEEVVNQLDLPTDFGDWEAEYRALVDSCALIGRVDRGVVFLTGDKPAEMLNGLVTNQVTATGGSGRYALQLTAKGRVLTDLRAFPTSVGIWVDVPRAGLQNLLATFSKYLPPLYARFEDASERIRHLAVHGPRAPTTFEEALGVSPPTEHLGVNEIAGLSHEPVLVVRNRRMGDAVELIGSEASIARLAADLLPSVRRHGGRLAGARALEVARVEWGVPLYGVDMSEDNLAQETGLVDAISYDKGCYLGQEVVSRIHFRGHVNRHLRSLAFLGSELPPPPAGAELLAGSKQVGVVTSAVSSPEFGSIGLGYVRHEIEPGETLRWAGTDAEGSLEVREAPFRARSV